MAIVKGKNEQLHEKQPNGQYRNVTGAVARKMKKDRESSNYSIIPTWDEMKRWYKFMYMFFRYLFTFSMIFVVYMANKEFGIFAPTTICTFVISANYLAFWLARRSLFSKKTAISIVVVISLVAEIVLIPSILFTVGLFSGEMQIAILILLIAGAGAYLLFFRQSIEESIVIMLNNKYQYMVYES